MLQELSSYFNFHIFVATMIYMGIFSYVYMQEFGKENFFGLSVKDILWFELVGDALGIFVSFFTKAYLLLGLYLFMGLFFTVQLWKKRERTSNLSFDFNMDEAELEEALQRTTVYITVPNEETKRFDAMLPLLDLNVSYHNKSTSTIKNLMLRCPIPEKFISLNSEEITDANGNRYCAFLIKKLRPGMAIECSYSLAATPEVLGKESHVKIQEPQYQIFMNKKPDISEGEWNSVFDQK